MAEVNWIATVLGAVLSFLAGWAWYSPMLFGPKWAEGSGVEMNSADKMPVDAMAAQLLGLVVMSAFTGAMLAKGLPGLLIAGTAAFAILAWSGNTFSGKTVFARNVDAGYWAVSLVIMIAVHSIL